MDKFYITTAIDYVNGKAHIGHAYEKILTDILARHYKHRVKDVYFLTGTDEHGIKIQKTAKALGISEKALCDQNVSDFKQTWAKLNISYNKFIRTTDEQHKKVVQDIFEKLLKQGDIYKHSYTGLYCSGCESFLNPKDLDENGLCPQHLKAPERVSEENYFFKLTKYKDRIIDYIKSNPDFIIPSFRANEVLNQLDNIEDISVSRSKASVSWGIDVKSDPSQIIYVWIDALSNYITALGYDIENPSDNFKKYWNADIQVIGKDILKFHSIYWLAILMALDLELPKHIFAHGWITIDETKMSKSLGNVISPVQILEDFNLEEPDAFRYFMAVSAAFGKDGNYSDEDFKERVNADLANNMGNLLNRTLNMLIKYFDGELKSEYMKKDPVLFELCKETVKKVNGCFDNIQISEAAFEIMSLLNAANKYVNDMAPWSLAKQGEMEKCALVLYNVLEVMRYVAVLIDPYCPNLSLKIAKQLKCRIDINYDDLEKEELKIGKIITKEDIVPVFLRLESEIAADKKRN